MRRLLGLILIFALFLSLPVYADAATWENGFLFRAVDGYAEIIDASPDLSGDIVIPDYFGGYGVEYIGVESFKDCKNITSITFGENVHGIYYGAFSGCENLTTVNFNAKTYSAKSSAGSPERPVFADCPKLTTVNIGEGVEALPKYLFYGVESLKTVNFEGTMPKIGQDAFKGTSWEASKPVSSAAAPSSSAIKRPVSSTTANSSSPATSISSKEADTAESSVPAVSSRPSEGKSNTGIIIIASIGGALSLALVAACVLLLKDSKK